jgi:quercetin dioxygenase-like cupin family protein
MHGLTEYNRGMITRRETLTGAVALLVELGAAHAQTRNQTTGERGQGGSGSVFKHDLPNLTMDDWEVTVSYVDYPPGRVGQTHHHAGFVLAYVLQGAVVTKISGQEERTYRTGEMFFEPPGSTHEVSNNASTTEAAKLLAMIFAKKGVQLTTSGPA